MEDIKKKDEAYMRRALMEAQAAFDEDEIPVGAIIVCRRCTEEPSEDDFFILVIPHPGGFGQCFFQPESITKVL